MVAGGVRFGDGEDHAGESGHRTGGQMVPEPGVERPGLAPMGREGTGAVQPEMRRWCVSVRPVGDEELQAFLLDEVPHPVHGACPETGDDAARMHERMRSDQVRRRNATLPAPAGRRLLRQQ